ncbi:MAG: UDP-N-acetylglucosamine 4,6-dehydratase, partial [Sulfuricurvum sp.]|nr:UDP-N-acetylglucosamine 4,6-dehydratase [Sulfuricurvum sp.]
MQWLRPNNAKRILFFLISDTFLSLFTLYSAYLLRFNFEIPNEFLAPFSLIAATFIILKLIFIYEFKNYSIIWRFYGLEEAKNLFFAHILTYGIIALIHIVFPSLFYPFPRSVIIIDLVLSLIFLGSFRLSKRIILGIGTPRESLQPTLLIGISPNTANLIKSTLNGESGYYPLGIIAVQEKNHNMIGSTIQNITVSGLDHIGDLVASKKITAAIIDGTLPNEYLRETYQLLSDAGVNEIKRSRLLDNTANRIEELSVEDLLARHPKDLDTPIIGAFIHGKKVLITGAGGSIGSEIALQCHRFGA